MDAHVDTASGAYSTVGCAPAKSICCGQGVVRPVQHTRHFDGRLLATGERVKHTSFRCRRGGVSPAHGGNWAWIPVTRRSF